MRLSVTASWQPLGVPNPDDTPINYDQLNATASAGYRVLALNEDADALVWVSVAPQNLNAGAAGVNRILTSTGGQGMEWSTIKSGSIAPGAVTGDKLHVNSHGYEETIIWQATALSNGVWSATTSATQTLPNSRTFATYDQIVVICYGTADGAANAHISAPYDLSARSLALGSSLFNANARCEFALPGGAGVFGLLTNTTWNVRSSTAGNQVVMLIGRQRRPIT